MSLRRNIREEVYKQSGKSYFYGAYKVVKVSKSAFIGYYIHKIWNLLGQRAPTLNFGEKRLRSPYGRPFYKMITGRDVPREL